MKHPFILVCLLFASLPGAERNDHLISIQKGIETLLASKKCPASSIGITLLDPRITPPLAAINADSMFNPASVMKLLTAAAAFEKLGPGFNFTTRVFADTILSRDSGITVQNLYIQGGGDPGFSAERLWLFVEHLYHRGLRRIAGNLFLDDFFFDSATVGPGFDEDSTCRSYQPYINALAMNFNTVAIHHRPGPRLKQPIAVDLFPEISGIQVTTLATTVPKLRQSELEVSTVADPGSGSTHVLVQGVMGFDEPGGYTYRKLWQTWKAFGGALLPLFARRGITLEGAMVHRKVPTSVTKQTPFYEFASLPLSDAIGSMFKYSSNFAAEMVFKTLSARCDSVQGSWEKSSILLSSWWRDNGLHGVPIIKNGSGMGNTNRISPTQVAALLAYVWKQKAFYPEYLSALSTSGIDGTLKSRFSKSKLKGLIRGKTGTLNSHGVSTLAGYLLLPGKDVPYAFAIFCGKTGQGQYEDWLLQESILEKMYESLK